MDDNELNLKTVISNNNKGATSSVKLYKISKETRENFERTKNIVLSDEIVVKKNYTFLPNHKLFEYFGGIKGQIEREINALKKLYNYKHFPLLLSTNPENNYIIMNYCGKSLNKDNIPNDWKCQIKQIVKTLKKCNIFNNDVWMPNLLIKDDIIHLIDFGWASSKNDYLFRNINDEDLNMTNNFIELLDIVYQRGAKERSKLLKKLK